MYKKLLNLILILFCCIFCSCTSYYEEHGLKKDCGQQLYKPRRLNKPKISTLLYVSREKEKDRHKELAIEMTKRRDELFLEMKRKGYKF